MSTATLAQPLRRQAAPAEAPRRHLDLVRPQRTTRTAEEQSRDARRVGVLAGGIAVGGILALLFVLAVLQTALAQGQAHLDEVNAQTADRQAEAQALALQVAQLEAPERIIGEAEIRLGMVEPTEVIYVERADPSVPVPADPAAATTAPAVP
jgi:cell division protein FtsL